MKAKNGKRGVFAALTAALLVMAALITSCPEPAGGGAASEGYQPPEGMGYITVNIPGFSGERTILPSAPVSWTSYDLKFEQYAASAGGTPTNTISKTGITDLTSPINLAPGYYELTVTANTSVGAAAEGTYSSRITVSPGAGQSVTVYIKPLPFTATGSGTFEYTIDVSGAPTGTTVEMTLTSIVPGAAPPSFSTVFDGSTNTISLTPGSYSVSLEATVGATTNKAYMTEVVNIHQNLTSKVKFTFNGSYFAAYINGITVIYETDDVKPELVYGSSVAIAEGGTITLSLPAVTGSNSVTITVTNNDEFSSLNWYANGKTGTISNTGGGTFTLTAGEAATDTFDEVKIYPVTVEGIITGIGAYSTNFNVSIVN